MIFGEKLGFCWQLQKGSVAVLVSVDSLVDRQQTGDMNELQTLKLTAYTPVTIADPVQLRRTKLAGKLAEQIEAAKAAATGNTYLAQRVRRTRTAGVTTTETVERRVRHWFRAVDDRRWAVMAFYGSKQLEFGKGKNAVEVANLAGVAAVFDKLRKAVLAGELDSQITSAAETLKRGFRK